MAYKGQFRPNNPKKYKGDATNIIYRSLWELKLMSTLDRHPDVLEWSSEEIVIPYRSPIDGKVHRYFPDFWVKKRLPNGKVVEELIEVKPKKQTQPPKIQTTKNQKPARKYLNEVKTWGINSAKWKAAEAYCQDRGWKFQIFHEDHLGIK